MEEKYRLSNITELINWGKQLLVSGKYPNELQLDKASKIVDCKYYIESMTMMIGARWENPTYYPCIDQFYRFREVIEKMDKAAE
ncbi:DUF6965 family protein [Bacteroides fragilis]